MSRFRLKHEEQVAIFLGLLIIWKRSFLDFGGIIEVAGDFVLLEPKSVC
jgi:hypothetical protein